MNALKALRLVLLTVLLSFFLQKSFAGSVQRFLPVEEGNSLVKDISFLVSEGLVEPVVEIGAGASFQQHVQKFKKYNPNTPNSSPIHVTASRFIGRKNLFSSGQYAVPTYLFIRCLLI